MSILTFHGVNLNVAGKQILDQVDWQIQEKQRAALVGRNGAGKTTLLKLLQGEIIPDQGKIHKQNGLKIAGLMQEVPIHEKETVYHFLVSGLGDTGKVLAGYYQAALMDDLEQISSYQQKIDALQAWDILPQIEIMATRLGLDKDAPLNALSGGMKRRALLASALIAAPDLLLLDEPTNHLDIEAIEWLESYLKNYRGSFILVTHDREFLAQVVNEIIEIDRGKLYTYHCSYETYLDRREARREAEQTQNNLFDKRLSEEEAWIRTGIKARRTRNEGRVRALKAMREAYQQRREQAGKVKGLNLGGERSGHLVVEADKIEFSYSGSPIVQDFSLLLTRGDKLGIIGPNGCGKTTLVRLLLGELVPEAGRVRQGTSLQVAYFDQLRRHLNEQQTVLENVADGSEHVTIQGKTKHVAAYLKDFLFAPETFNQPVFSLSGGERNRLLLAKLFAKPVNFLVMDEPTNDLDIETLELLENILMEYPGTLLLISHDRAFINQVVTSVLIYEGKAKFNEYVGGYDDYKEYKKQQEIEQSKKSGSSQSRKNNNVKLSFNEQRELSQLPEKIEMLEQRIELLQLEMTTPDFYQKKNEEITEFKKNLDKQENDLIQLLERWEELEGKVS